MVIGSGLMAKTFSSYKDDDSVLIFASGVANSTTNQPKEFRREFDLLKAALADHSEKKLVYFSTCSIHDPSVNRNPYVKHKLEVEAYLTAHAATYLILRLPNVVGPNGNKNTLFNYLFNAVQTNAAINVWEDAERNLIDKDDVIYIVDHLLREKEANKIINVASRLSLKVIDILHVIEQHLDKKARYHLIKKGNPLSIDISEIDSLLKEVEARKGKGLVYVDGLLKKYSSK
jgi:nucleoside-diphosphate-sugar epimerase